MKSAANLRALLFIFLSLFLLPGWANTASSTRCGVCGMEVSSASKTSFEIVDTGKHSKVCSFSCASKLRERHPRASFSVADYLSGDAVPATESFFLIKSKALASEVTFGMPPVVAAFKSSQSAEDTKKRLGDGETIKGFDAARLRFK